MPIITRQLLRKRSEHNEGIISTMEEISLHQEEIEGINEVLGSSCRKLKIIYLQNNIIPKMENLHHLKELVYLNLALNNIQKIEGLQNCEFLTKLDLTANFIDVDELADSINHLQSCERLREIYLMGNPSQSNWDGFTSYVIAKLPQLQTLDGTEITRSMQITARQRLAVLEADLLRLAVLKRAGKREKQLLQTSKAESKVISALSSSDEVIVEDVPDDEDENELTENTPETRVEIYRELAEQKKEKEDREKANQPKERNYEKEQAESVALLRQKEQEMSASEIKQKNEGGWEFYWDEESRPGFVILEVKVARFLDSSLIDVDVHPGYVSMIIKSKMLRLRLPAEVKAAESKCQRSKTSGSLLIVMPKDDPRANAISIRGEQRRREEAARVTPPTGSMASKFSKKATSAAIPAGGTESSGSSRTRRLTAAAPGTKKLSLQEQMLQAAGGSATAADGSGEGSSKAVDIGSIVRRPRTATAAGVASGESTGTRETAYMRPLSTSTNSATSATPVTTSSLPSSAEHSAPAPSHSEQRAGSPLTSTSSNSTCASGNTDSAHHTPTVVHTAGECNDGPKAGKPPFATSSLIEELD